MKIFLDPGHGGIDTGATGNGLIEKDLTLDIGLRIRDTLKKEYPTIEIMMSRNTDADISLEERTQKANNWGADFFLSIHINSLDKDASGYEDHIHEMLSTSSKTAKIQSIIHKEIVSMCGLADRGTKQTNFHVLRETSMPALLTENGFITNPEDAKKLADPKWRQSIAQAHVNGIVRSFGLSKEK